MIRRLAPLKERVMITLSENATADRPILKMIDNPMGITSFLWEIYRKKRWRMNFGFLKEVNMSL